MKTEAQKEANKKYQAKYDLVQIRLPKGTKLQLEEKLAGREAISEYVCRLISSDCRN